MFDKNMTIAQKTRWVAYIFIFCALVFLSALVFGGWIYLNHIDLFTGKLAPTSHDWQGLTAFYRNSIFILCPIGVILFFYYSYLMWSLSKEIYKIEQASPANHRPSGTSGTASADSAARAEAMPEASGDS